MLPAHPSWHSSSHTRTKVMSLPCWEAGTGRMVFGMPCGRGRVGGSKGELEAQEPMAVLLKRESQTRPCPLGELGGLWQQHWEPAGKSLPPPWRSLERLVLPMIAWTNSCARASSSPLVSCNYCPSVLLERHHLLLLHHQSSPHLPGAALSPESSADRADGAAPEVPRCSLSSITSKAAAPATGPADPPPATGHAGQEMNSQAGLLWAVGAVTP